jgi:hypothetical protein
MKVSDIVLIVAFFLMVSFSSPSAQSLNTKRSTSSSGGVINAGVIDSHPVVTTSSATPSMTSETSSRSNDVIHVGVTDARLLETGKILLQDLDFDFDFRFSLTSINTNQNGAQNLAAVITRQNGQKTLLLRTIGTFLVRH